MAGFAGDRVSGSSTLALAFLDELERWLGADRSPSAAAVRSALLQWLRDAQASQPTMALVHQLAARALAVADTGAARGDSPLDLRKSLLESCAAERGDLDAAKTAAAKFAADLVPQKDAWIATLSSSEIVALTIAELHARGQRPRVLIAESRPNLEGRVQAAAFAALGIPVWIVADAALPMLLQQAACVLIGADAITESGVINKIGSYVAALAAREHGVPVWALGVRRKMIPSDTRALGIQEMAPDELWDAAPSGVRPRNVYFEIVPTTLLRGVVVEDAVLGATELRVAVADRELPAELAGAVTRG
jgi:translation initiation factor 2B subunit (eIF-2B alpha/beta/delta family)